MPQLKLIQCGVGGFGAGWLNVVKANADVQCVALVDPNRENMDKAVEKLGFDSSRVFASLEAALGAVDADAVLTVTPPAVHFEHARLAFANGLHLITEKPIADTLEHGAEMVRLAKKAGRQLMVSQNYRYNAAPRFVRSLVAEKKLGDLAHVDVTFGINADFRGTFRETMDYPLLVDMSIHHFDLMRYVLGANAKSIYIRSIKTKAPQYRHDCAFKGILEFENGVVVNYSGDWGSPRLPTSWNGAWGLQFDQGLLYWNDAELYSEHSEPWGNNRQKKFYSAPNMPVSGQAYSLAEFVKAIRENREAETSGADNLHSFGLVEAALQSIRRGAPVMLKDVVPAV
jgi:predicted dehydrogenase